MSYTHEPVAYVVGELIEYLKLLDPRGQVLVGEYGLVVRDANGLCIATLQKSIDEIPVWQSAEAQ
jgi:hypothetical protein